MQTKHRILAGILGIAACAGLVAAQNAPAAGRHVRGARLARLLNLTPDQKTQAKAIMTAGREQAKPVAGQLKIAREALATAVTNNAPDAQIDQLSAAIGPLTSQLASIRAKSAARLYAILTPDQRTQFNALKQKRQGYGGLLGPAGD